jgi:L-2,4-diaminobutyric acid acetyltransferase
LSLLKNVDFRMPLLEDGMPVFNLINRCPPLDTNSSYCNFLQCGHFSNTSVMAIAEDKLVGFISGYCLPDRPNTLFIWQVAIDELARGHGLASRMLLHILSRSSCASIQYLETTITESNHASWALFRGLAKRLSTDIESSIYLDQHTHFKGQHDAEELVRIGPFNIAQARDLE